MRHKIFQWQENYSTVPGCFFSNVYAVVNNVVERGLEYSISNTRTASKRRQGQTMLSILLLCMSLPSLTSRHDTSRHVHARRS